jgi:FkbM family methyltransferase
MTDHMLKAIHHKVRTTPALGRIAIRAIPNICTRVTVAGIGSMSINLRRNRNYWIRDPLIHELFMLGALQRLVKPGDVVFDAGANIGLYCRFLVQRFGAAKVIAFEPMEENHVLLRRNISLGNCQDRIEVIRVALADYDGYDQFQTDDMSSASGTLNVITGGEACQGRQQYGLPPLTETVSVRRLDSLVEDGRVPIPQVIKMDVEGAEERLLRGGIRILRNYGPALAIELHGIDPARAVLEFLWSIRYHCFGFLQTEDGCQYKEITQSDSESITDQYSLHFCIAGPDVGILSAPPMYRS